VGGKGESSRVSRFDGHLGLTPKPQENSFPETGRKKKPAKKTLYLGGSIPKILDWGGGVKFWGKEVKNIPRNKVNESEGVGRLGFTGGQTKSKEKERAKKIMPNTWESSPKPSARGVLVG